MGTVGQNSGGNAFGGKGRGWRPPTSRRQTVPVTETIAPLPEMGRFNRRGGRVASKASNEDQNYVKEIEECINRKRFGWDGWN
jgi:hypothetical protein